MAPAPTARRVVAVLLLFLLVLAACGEREDEAAPTPTPTPTPTPAADVDELADDETLEDEGPEVLWQEPFSSDFDWEDDAGVVEASRTSGGVVEEGPEGRSDVLEIWFGEDGSRWGIDLRHDFDEMGVGPREEVYFSYDVYFPEDFEFIGDGKLGGLAGITDGLEPLETSSGGDYDERSFSVRPMWKRDRGVVMYLYARSADGRDFDNPEHFGFGIPVPFVDADGSESDIFAPDTWHRVEQRVRLNTPGETDGIYELWIDGHKGVSVDDVQYRTEAHPDLQINQLFTSWFFGGGAEEFPTRVNVAYSDSWALTTGLLGVDPDVFD
jgi:hypothetical protein